MQPMYAGQPNSPQTELATAIDEAQTTIEVLNGGVLPDAPNLAVIGAGELAETIRYGAKEGNTLSNVERGFQGVAQSWQEGTKIARNFTAYDYDALRQNVEEVQSELENLDLDAANVTLESSKFTATNVKDGMDELFTNVSDGKDNIAAAISDMNQPASGSDTFSELAEKIRDISSDATAVAGDILAGKTAYANGKITGTMTNRGAVNQTISSQNGQYTIPQGYHNGTGRVTASFANLSPANVRQGINIGGVVGNLTPGTPQIYREGTEYNTFINGYRTTSNTPTFSRTQSRLQWYVNGANNGQEASLVTQNIMDFTNVMFLYLDVSYTYNATKFVCLSSTRDASYTVYDWRSQLISDESRTIALFDVSSLTGSFYLRLHALAVVTNQQLSFTLYKALTINNPQ